ncbi:ArsR/SmtB family transcription factor [Halorhabdus salina]|uniref:ArsR/SmtB family transcription factor n=1 Tax=Halorhabdus salina TaxID=2750670 RepID=UPI001C671CB9|nr:winged helix-turn-helix domain-containing protein [Halorhabdus salina]
MDVDDERDVATVTALLADNVVRAILEACLEEPHAAERLSERCDVSESTVYRRLEELEALDLVAARMEPDDDGHHYKVYVATLDRIVVDLTDDGFTVRITRRQRMADRFTEFVEGVGR